jgi:DNA-binding MarR family transcriptional regulator
MSTSSKDQAKLRQLTWILASVDFYLQELRNFWATTLAVSEPQWRILITLLELDREGRGVPVNVLSKRLLAHASSITAQSKILEQSGFLRRRRSTDDARAVHLSLTDTAYKRIEALSSRRGSLDDFIFAELDEKQLNELNNVLTALDRRLEKAPLKLLVDR